MGENEYPPTEGEDDDVTGWSFRCPCECDDDDDDERAERIEARLVRDRGADADEPVNECMNAGRSEDRALALLEDDSARPEPAPAALANGGMSIELGSTRGSRASRLRLRKEAAKVEAGVGSDGAEEGESVRWSKAKPEGDEGGEGNRADMAQARGVDARGRTGDVDGSGEQRECAFQR